MSEEKKPQQDPAGSEVKKPAEAEKPAEPAKKEEAPPLAEEKNKETAAGDKAQPAAAPDAAKEKAPAEKTTPTNCVQCNKSIKKIRWYYRDGKYYCTKNCWATAMKKDAAKAADAQAPESK